MFISKKYHDIDVRYLQRQIRDQNELILALIKELGYVIKYPDYDVKLVKKSKKNAN